MDKIICVKQYLSDKIKHDNQISLAGKIVKRQLKKEEEAKNGDNVECIDNLIIMALSMVDDIYNTIPMFAPEEIKYKIALNRLNDYII